MSKPAFLARFRDDVTGAAAEFVLVLPLALLFLIGIIDGGRYFYEVNEGEKATQIGVRWAVATDVIAPGLEAESYVGKTVNGATLTQGDTIPEGALGTVTCDNVSCACSQTPCPTTLGYDSAAFNRLLNRMQLIKGDIAAENLVVEYRGSGLGFAGDPNGMDIAPLTTVRLRNMTFPSTVLFGTQINLPSFSSTMTMEDGDGTGSN